MNRTGYTVLGWLVWQVATRVARRKLAEHRIKLAVAAGAVVALGIGIAAAASQDEDDDA